MTILNRVKDYMDEKIVAISPESSATDAAKLMLGNTIGSLVVKKGEIYLGVLTEGDISRKVTALEKDPAKTLVIDIMVKDIIAVESRSTMRSAFLEMNKRKIRHIAVTENGRYVGILSIKDFANYYSSRVKKRAKT
ncbi:MAG: CBS domain-containing protein [Nitrospinae bacterium]|nr:CBS domain-containing protein [Nitrospinota bacterium]